MRAITTYAEKADNEMKCNSRYIHGYPIARNAYCMQTANSMLSARGGGDGIITPLFQKKKQ